MSNPVKNCFLIGTFLYENKIFRTQNFFCRDCTFLQVRGLENSCLLHQTGNVQITSLLHVKLEEWWTGKVWSRHENIVIPLFICYNPSKTASIRSCILPINYFLLSARAFVAIICVISFLFSDIENTITYKLLNEKKLQPDTSFSSKATVIASIASLILLIGKKLTQGTIIYFFDGRSLSRHKQRLFIQKVPKWNISLKEFLH